MDNNSTTKGYKVNSAEIIEYAKQMIDDWNKEYKGAAPGEFDIDVFSKMTEIINNLMKAAVKLEALKIISKLPNSNDDTNHEIATAVSRMLMNY